LKKQLESDSEDSDKPVTDVNMNDTPTQAENQNHYDAHETII
jgi:hypothetical protein